MPGPVIAWLLASDPAVAWQVLRDLADAPASVWSAQRRRVETEGWGAELLSHQDPDVQWAGAAFWPAGFTREDGELEGHRWDAAVPVGPGCGGGVPAGAPPVPEVERRQRRGR